jgi:hypothetical protein
MARERCPQELCGASRDLNEEPSRGSLGTEDGLHSRATLSPDRCHLDDAAVRINLHHRHDVAVWEIDVVKRTIRIGEDLLPSARNVGELREKLLEIVRWQGEQEPVLGPTWRIGHTVYTDEVALEITHFGRGALGFWRGVHANWMRGASRILGGRVTGGARY